VAPPGPSVPSLTPFEVAVGRPALRPERIAPLPGTPRSPYEALVAAVLPALRRPPCGVAFSGGLDSSLVLAAAVEAARRARLPPPVPVTLRFEAGKATDEAAWQELVVRHLGVTEWVRIPIGDELDLVGPIATGTLLRHGLLWPPNVHMLVPLMSAVPGGALLTGHGGDHLLSRWSGVRIGELLRRQRRPAPRDALRLAYAAAPPALRALREGNRVPGVPWLRPAPRRRARADAALHAAEAPRDWGGWLAWRLATRDLRTSVAHLEALARDAGVALVHPLVAPEFAAALARAGGRAGLGARNDIVGRVAGHALPPQLVARRTKASFNAGFWAGYSRDHAARWDGEGVDERLVDPERLRAAWRSDTERYRAATLLRATWLATRSGDGQPLAQRLDDAGQRFPAARD
jgi:Asparagine synthase